LYARDLLFWLIGVVWDPKILGIASLRDASHLPKGSFHPTVVEIHDTEGEVDFTGRSIVLLLDTHK
jgi:hypothetical protein